MLEYRRVKFPGLVYFWIVKWRKEEVENGEKENTDHENNGWTEQTGEKQGVCMNMIISNPKSEWRLKYLHFLNSPFWSWVLSSSVSTDGITRTQIRNTSLYVYTAFVGKIVVISNLNYCFKSKSLYNCYNFSYLNGASLSHSSRLEDCRQALLKQTPYLIL